MKSRKNIIEIRALRLVESVKRNWFPNKQKSKVVAKHDVDRPILLSITDVISIAAPIMEEFARKPIASHKRGSDSDPPSFEALYWIVRAYAKDGARAKNRHSIDYSAAFGNGRMRAARKIKVYGSTLHRSCSVALLMSAEIAWKSAQDASML